jgi:hypothetical protein
MESTVRRAAVSQIAIYVAVALLLAGCKKTSAANGGLGDSALLSHDSTSVALADRPLAASISNYTLDDNRYRQWTIAQQRLDSLGPIDAPVRLTSLNPSPADIDRTVAFLESRPDTRNALAASGLSARDYVLTTLALAQARAAAVDSETENERFLAQHRTEFDEAVSRSKFRVVDYDDKGKHGRGGKGHEKGKHKGRGHGKH